MRRITMLDLHPKKGWSERNTYLNKDRYQECINLIVNEIREYSNEKQDNLYKKETQPKHTKTSKKPRPKKSIKGGK